MRELQAHFGKRKTVIKINLPLTQEARDILKEALLKIADILKLDDVEITETKPYKLQKKQPKQIPKEPELSKEERMKKADRLFNEIEELLKEIENSAKTC